MKATNCLFCWYLTGEELMTMIMLICEIMQSCSQRNVTGTLLLSRWFTQIQYKSALKNLFFINLTFRQFCGLKSLSWLFVTGWKTKVLHAVSSSETSFCKTPSDLLVFSSERRLLCSLRVNYSESRGGKSLKPPLSAAYLRGVNRYLLQLGETPGGTPPC